MRNVFFISAVWIVLTIVPLLPVSALGAETEKEPADSESVKMDTLVVTGEKQETDYQTGDAILDETPASAIVIERENFDNRLLGLPDIIEKETGVQVRRTGGLGSFSSLSLRGSTNDQVMVFMDGVLLNDASGGGVDLSTIPLGDIDTITVYKGAAPIHFNNAPIGGVVHIKTLRSGRELKTGVTAGYGSFNSRTANGYISDKLDTIDYLLSADYQAADNDFEFVNDRGTPLNPSDDRVEKRNNAQFFHVNILGKIGYDPGPGQRLTFQSQWLTKNNHLPSWNNHPTTSTTLDTDRFINSLKYIRDGVFGLPVNTVASLRHTLKNEVYDDSEGHIGLGSQLTEYDTARYGGNIFTEWTAAGHTLGTVLDLYHESYDVSDGLHNKTPTSSYRNSFSAGIQDTIYLFENRLFLVPALQYTYSYNNLSTTESGDLSAPQKNTTTDRQFVTPQFGIKYRPWQWIGFHANLGRHFREPHFYELSGDRGIITGNADLKAEESINLDAGFEINAQSETVLLQSLTLSSTVFHNRVNDMIVVSYDARGIGKPENVDGAIVQGIEAGLKWRFLDFLELMANATLQDSENLSAEKVTYGEKLPGRWEQQYLGRLTAEHKGLEIYVEYLLSKNMFYDNANLLKAEDKKELNTGLAMRIAPLSVRFTVRNIQDSDYEDFNGYPLPGRAYYVTATYTY